jgi:hypothetical protein
MLVTAPGNTVCILKRTSACYQTRYRISKTEPYSENLYYLPCCHSIFVVAMTHQHRLTKVKLWHLSVNKLPILRPL